jgi:hypothetical protein
MPDDPKTVAKVETKVEPTPDPDMAQLAAQIAGEPDVITEGKDSVSAASKPTSEEKKGASKGEEKPEAEGDEEPEDGKKEDGEEDPLKDLAGNKAGVLKILLDHPVIGPLLNKWNDKSAEAQVIASRERERPAIEADTRRSEVERNEDEHFSGMTQEQISEEIAGDEKAASAYARYQQRKQAGEEPNVDAIAQASQVYSYTSRIAAVRELLEGSELPADVIESLKPEHFTHLKAEGIREWEKAVFKAIVTHEASGMAEKLKEDAWEAYKEEHLAELDGDRPAIVSGRKDGPTPDLLKTDSGTLLEGALSQTPKKG